MKRDPYGGTAGAGGDPAGDPPAPAPGGGAQGSGGTQGPNAGGYDPGGPLDVVALARGLDDVKEADPPAPVLRRSQLHQVLKPRPAPLPLWIWILMAGAGLVLCGVVGMKLYRTQMERRAAETTAAAAVAKAAKEAKARADAAKALKEAEERAEAERKAAAEREKAAAEAAALAAAAAANDPTKGNDKSSRGSRSRSHSRGGEAEEPVDSGPVPPQLSREDILKGMQGIQPQVSACFAQYHVPGTALVGITIGSNGKVQKAKVAGPLAGTPTGDCITKAVKGATFGRFSAKAMSIQYPIVLR
jgi:hypothetical protein